MIRIPLADSSDVSGAPCPRDLRGVLTADGKSAVADVVVCVRDAVDDVRLCLWSLLAYTDVPLHLVIVDDASTEPTIAFLNELVGREPAISLTRRSSDAEHGYPWAANDGLSRCSAPWTVLLNSDCIVPPGWLSGLLRAAEESGASLVGPLSNAATYQSVPATRDGTQWRTNELPASLDVPAMSALVEHVSLGANPRVPALNGFCLAVSAVVRQSLPGFDTTAFGPGYGEETDLAIHAGKAGFSLAVADRVFVYHRKSRSYGSRRDQLAAAGQASLREKHGSEAIDALIRELEQSPELDLVRARIGDAVASIQSTSEAILDGTSILVVAPPGESLADAVREQVTELNRLGVRAVRLVEPERLTSIELSVGDPPIICGIGVAGAHATAQYHSAPVCWLLDGESAATELARNHPQVPILVRTHLAENHFAHWLNRRTVKVHPGIGPQATPVELPSVVRLRGIHDDLADRLTAIADGLGWRHERDIPGSNAAIEVLGDGALRDPAPLLVSMSSGALCLAIGSGVHEELIEHGFDGLVARRENIESLLVRAILDQRWRALLSIGARIRARRHGPVAGALSLAVAAKSIKDDWGQDAEGRYGTRVRAPAGTH
jgi:GT2 family glycosyltransferase